MTMPELKDRANTGGTERRVFAAQIEVRAKADGAGGTRYELDGYASAYDSPYQMYDMFGEYEEVVRSGAGAKTLSENPDVVLVFNHAGLPMARTKAGNLELSEDDGGLHMRASNLNGNQSVVRDVVAGIEDGVLDEMSFAFRVTRQEWSPDWMQRDILEYNIHRGDVSVVTYGANPATSVALRSEDLTAMLAHLEGDALRRAAETLSARLGTEAPMTQRHPLSLYDAEARLLTMPPVA
jgi:HK97 family phage prohead protease